MTTYLKISKLWKSKNSKIFPWKFVPFSSFQDNNLEYFLNIFENIYNEKSESFLKINDEDLKKKEFARNYFFSNLNVYWYSLYINCYSKFSIIRLLKNIIFIKRWQSKLKEKSKIFQIFLDYSRNRFEQFKRIMLFGIKTLCSLNYYNGSIYK